MTTDPTRADEAPIPYLSLAAAIAAISVAGAGFGHSLPLFSLLLEEYGVGDFEIGLNTGIAAIAALIGAPFYPRMIAKTGLKVFVFLALATMVAPYLLIHAAGENIGLWYPLRFIFVIGGGALFAGSEIWINAVAPDRVRGRVIGLYGTCLALGFALGPLLLKLTGYQGFLPFAVGGAVFASAAIPLAIAAAPAVEPHSEGSIFKEMRRDPVLFGSASMFAGVETAMLVFLPILALELGHGVGIGAQLLTVYGVGLLLAQVPVGWLSEIFNPRKVMAGCALIAAVLALMIPAVQAWVLPLYAVLFVWGAAVGGIYTTGLVSVGNTYKGTRLAAANTGFVFAYALGGVIGPLVAGGLRGGIGPNGMIAGIALSLGLYAWAAARRGAAAGAA